jgi:crotonobetainyl-CoA:carnitine CoA-transferase CaiB-like acyl-CoA transferase
MALEGIRVVDATQAWAGPAATLVLADMGAEVIKVESIQRIDGWRLFNQIRPTEDGWWERSAHYNSVNRNKHNVTLDLTRPRGAQIFKQLVKIGDMVTENYTPRVMRNFGLDYPVLKEINPSIVMMSMPGWGMTGPWRDFVGFGATVEQFSGLCQLSGYPDGGPILLGSAMAIGDPVGALNAAFALLIALQHRRRTGRGQYIDLSQNEEISTLIGDAIMDYTLNKRVQARRGNRHPCMAPHGCYRCRDENNEDKWVVIAVSSDEAWMNLARAMGNPAWANEQRFSDPLSRWQNQDELDKLIEEWTRQHTHYEIMTSLQAVGVAAAAVFSPAELLSDPHLKERGFFENITLPQVGGTHPYPGFFYKMSKTPGRVRKPTPTLGQDNEFVLGELLGLSRAEIAQLAEEKIIGTRPLGV